MMTWKQQNLRSIQRNLAWLQHKPDGVLMTDVNGQDSIVVIKDNTEIQLFFVEHKTAQKDITLSGVMSRIDIKRPLYLLAAYSQVMMLSLLFSENPKRLYMMGFGGGRSPMLFHHHFPDLQIDGSELDARVLDLNEMLFGLSPSERIHVAAQDGISHFAPIQKSYDIILLDCFTGAGDQPTSITTPAFYELCRSKLHPQGVTVQYLIGSPNEIKHKTSQFNTSFPHSYYYSNDKTHVLFGLKAPPPPINKLIEKADAIAAEHQFSFPFSQHAKQLTTLFR